MGKSKISTMATRLVAALAVIYLSVSSATSSCEAGCSFETTNVQELIVATDIECADRCSASQDCAGFTFFDKPSGEKNCFLRADLRNPTPNSDALSGINPNFPSNIPTNDEEELEIGDSSDGDSSSEDELNKHDRHHHGHHRYHKGMKMAHHAVFIARVIGFVIFLIGLLWGLMERRRRRRELAPMPEREGSYQTGLFECFGRWRVCLPACLFTPVLAAFNRATADQRECNVCDVCFSLIKPVAQYTTRQSIRGRFELKDEPSDVLSACCCTPCAVAQDAIELEKRTAQLPQEAPNTAPGAPVHLYPAATVVVPSCPAYEDLDVETAKRSKPGDDQV